MSGTNLVLKLYPGESVTIGDSKVTFLEYDKGDRAARIAIEAPREVDIVRSSAKNKGAKS